MSIDFIRRFIGKGLSKTLPGAKPFAASVYRKLWPDGQTVDVQGSKMYVKLFDPDPSMEHTFRAYAFNRIHEETTTALFHRIVKPGHVVLDLGANIGYFTLLAAKLTGPTGRVFSFEPEPRNFGYLTKNIALNGYSHATAFQNAVADKPGTVELFLCPYDTGHHTIQSAAGIEAYRPGQATEQQRSVAVEQVRLDDFFTDKRTPINVIKMDVEGAESLALAGLEQIIQANPDLMMIVEFFPLLIREMGQSPEQFAHRLIDELRFQVSVVGQDYSMHDQKSGAELLPVRSVAELMALCGGRTDHLNLLLEKRGRR